MVKRRYRRWFLFLSPVLWKRRLLFWAGGIAVGIVAVGFAIGAITRKARSAGCSRSRPSSRCC